MRKHVKLAVLGLLATLAMALSASSASAITASPASIITATSQGNLTIGGGSFTISCPVTLTGTMASSIANSAGSHFGEITGGSVGTCNTGSASVLVSSMNPWEMRYNSDNLTSTPRTIALTMNRWQILVAAFGLTCLYEGSIPMTLEGEGEPVVTRLLRINSPNSLSKHVAALNSALCPGSVELKGTFSLTSQTLTLP